MVLASVQAGVAGGWPLGTSMVCRLGAGAGRAGEPGEEKPGPGKVTVPVQQGAQSVVLQC
jgi:hypothetical protein